MDVKSFILGVLSLGDASGYEIKKNLEGPFSHFFDASFGAIYPALNKMADEGLVSVQEVIQDNRPAKKVYAITDTGRAIFLEELHKGPGRDRIRSEFLVHMLFAFMHEPDDLRRVVDGYLHILRTELAHIESVEHCECDSPVQQNIHVGHEFVRGFGKAMKTAAITYVEEHRHMLDQAPITGQSIKDQSSVSLNTQTTPPTLAATDKVNP